MTNFKRIGIALAGAGLLMQAGCASKEARAPAKMQSSSAPGQASVEAKEESGEAADEEMRAGGDEADRTTIDVQHLVEGNNRLAFDLHKAMPSGNLVYSPYAIARAGAMLYAGASGDTREQLHRTFRISIPDEGLDSKFARLHQMLRSRYHEHAGRGRIGARVRVFDTLWADDDVSFETAFLTTAENRYLFRPRNVPFAKNPTVAFAALETYLSDATGNALTNMFPKGTRPDDPKLVLASAMTFNAAWGEPFPRAATKPAQFHGPNGSRRVEMMSRTGRANFFADAQLRAVELDYENSDVAALVIVPRSGKFSSVDAGLNASRFDWIVGHLRPANVSIHVPRFSLTDRHPLAKTLSGMGAPDAFDPAKADFSAMTGADDVALTAMTHWASYGFDESGSSAIAAATTPSGQVTPEVTLAADRPFLVLVWDRPTREILLISRVVAP